MIALRMSVGKQTEDINRQFDRIMRNLDKKIKEIEGATLEGMVEAMEPIFETSQEYVPVKTGELALSGFLEIDDTVKHPRVVIGYAARGKPDYAVIVHENLEVQHAHPTRAKYLETAVAEHFDDILPRVHRHVKSSVG